MMKIRDGLFLDVPLMPEGLEGVDAIEAATKAPLVLPPPRPDPLDDRRRMPRHRYDALYSAQRIKVWDSLRLNFGLIIRHWLATLSPAQREAMDPRILDRYRLEEPLSAATARALLRAGLEGMINGDMAGRIAVSDDYQFHLDPQTLPQILGNQLFEAVRHGYAYRLCDHCGRAYRYESEKARYCSASCRTLGWRKRKQEAA